MSTKIHNGYRLPSLSALSDTLAWAGEVRAVLTQAAVKEIETRVARRALELFDQDTARSHGRVIEGQADPMGHCVSRALSSTCEEVLQARRENRYSDLEPETTLALIPRGEDLFGILYSELPGIPKIFESLPGVSEYAYTNQVDAPPSLSEKQWAARGADWAGLLGPSGTPSAVSLSLTLVSPHVLFEVSGPACDADVAQWSGPQELQARARQVAMATPAANLPSHLLAQYKQTRGLGVWVRHHSALLNGEVPAFNREVEFLQGVLVPAPTLEQLTAPGAPAARAPNP